MLREPVPHDGVSNICDSKMSFEMDFDNSSIPLSNRCRTDSALSSLTASVVGTMPQARYPPLPRKASNSEGYRETDSR